MGVALLRRVVGEKFVTQIWGRSFQAGPIQKACPVCDSAMLGVSAEVPAGEVPVGLCRRCEFVWFDAGGFEAIPQPPPKPHVLGELDESKIPQELREKIAVQKVKDMADRAAAEEPPPGWKGAAAVLGLPVEIDSSGKKRTPWLTYAVAAGMVAVSAWGFSDRYSIIHGYGLVPADLWRMHGLTFLTSFFLHAGVMHLLGNLYFLMIFGAAVEDYLGRGRWLLLLVLAALAGDFLDVIMFPHGTVPLIGASGGISGLIAFYALKFPHARLGLRFFYFRSSWIVLSAWVAFVLWLLLQFLGAWQELERYSHVASFAHLGGVAVGIAAWGAWRRLDARAATPLPGLVKVIR